MGEWERIAAEAWAASEPVSPLNVPFGEHVNCSCVLPPLDVSSDILLDCDDPVVGGRATFDDGIKTYHYDVAAVGTEKGFPAAMLVAANNAKPYTARLDRKNGPLMWRLRGKTGTLSFQRKMS